MLPAAQIMMSEGCSEIVDDANDFALRDGRIFAETVDAIYFFFPGGAESSDFRLVALRQLCNRRSLAAALRW